jgi:hypothetical protein
MNIIIYLSYTQRDRPPQIQSKAVLRAVSLTLLVGILVRKLHHEAQIRLKRASDGGAKLYYMKGVFYSMSQWLRHCATNRKVTGSIPDGVTGIFH